MQTDPSETGDRQGLIAGLLCFTFWGLMPLLFRTAAHFGAAPLEIVAWRTLWSLPLAALLIVLIGRGGGLRALFANPRDFRALILSSLLIGTNWSVYVWAVNSGQTLSASLGYYINPLLNMLAGALFFGERIDRRGHLAIGLATIGVAIQGAALGAFPWMALLLGSSFCGYGVVRKQAKADAQTGLFVECAILCVPAFAYVLWLIHTGHSVFGTHLDVSLILLFCGPATVLPLAAFSYAARRLPLTIVGFLQFITPTIQFAIGIEEGETLTPLRALSFVFIWAGVAIFVFGARRKPSVEPVLAAD
jgi:chloramphenicol-sensitive protein RarD